LNNRVVLAFFGDPESRAAVQRWSASAEVIAVALDLGGAVPLTELRDGAIAAGAVRCHALDVREEFVREALLPVVRSGNATDPAEVFGTVAVDFVARKLRDVAALENAAVVRATGVAAMPKTIAPAPVPPTRLQIAFDAGVPVAVNGIPMTLIELMESVETITGESALTVLQREYALALA
jgi:argininosuccinate synthase